MTTPRPLRVLLVAERIDPTRPGEAQIAWQWANHLGPALSLLVITRSDSRRAIERAGGLPAPVFFVESGRGSTRARPRFDAAGGTSWWASLSDRFGRRSFERAAIRLARELRDRGEVDLIHRMAPRLHPSATRLGEVGLPIVFGPVVVDGTIPPGFPDPEPPEGRGSRIFGSSDRIFPRSSGPLVAARRILVADETSRQWLREEDRGEARILPPTALDVDRIEPRLDRSGPDLRVLFLGPLVSSEGLHFLLQAFSLLPHTLAARLDIVGEGPERERLEDLVREARLESRIRFHGDAPAGETTRWMRAADVFALPSLCGSGGRRVLEAMAAGTPVVVADRGGAAELVPPEAGILVPARSPQGLTLGLAEALRRLASKEPLRLSMARAARSHVERRHAWDVRLARALEIYEEALGDRRGPSPHDVGREEVVGIPPAIPPEPPIEAETTSVSK